jgi:hypothetical protein
MSLLDAVLTPRLHSQLIPDAVFVENATLYHHQPSIVCDPDVAAYLTILGHANVTYGKGGMGVTQYVAVETSIAEATTSVSSAPSVVGRNRWEGMWKSMMGKWLLGRGQKEMKQQEEEESRMTRDGTGTKYKVKKTIQGISDPRKDGYPAAL